MQDRKKRFYRIGLRVLLGTLFLCGASGAAAVYVGPDALLGLPSFEEVHGAECRAVVTIKAKDAHGLLIRQFIVAKADDDLVRMRTALRVAESVRKAQSPHLVQVSVVERGEPATVSAMRGRAIGAKVTLIQDPVTDIEKQSGAVSGFSIQGPAGPDGAYYGIRLEALPEDIERTVAGFENISGCTAEPRDTAPAGADS